VDVYLEVGTDRVFAGAIEWPGWSRSARREEGALEALFAAASRYATAVRGARPAFRTPTTIEDLEVVERLTGDSGTNFGALSVAPAADRRELDRRELTRLRRLLERGWTAFDSAVNDAEGVELRKGPRGGGRELDAIVEHVVGAEAGYVARLAAPRPRTEAADPRTAAPEVRAAAVDALARAVTDGLPETGPRGGAIWTPRFFVRRAAWHVLDHTWEIEDRAGAGDETGAGTRLTSRGTSRRR
jgi:hypothetical protein